MERAALARGFAFIAFVESDFFCLQDFTWLLPAFFYTPHIRFKGFAPLAKESFETEVVSGDPFSKVQTPAFLEEVLKHTGPEFAVAVGVAIRKLQELG